MQTENDTSKLKTEPQQEAREGCPAATCSQTVIIEQVIGVEGHCILINDRRVAGPKAWGGGRIVHTWETTRNNILEALGIDLPNKGMSDGAQGGRDVS